MDVCSEGGRDGSRLIKKVSVTEGRTTLYALGPGLVGEE